MRGCGVRLDGDEVPAAVRPVLGCGVRGAQRPAQALPLRAPCGRPGPRRARAQACRATSALLCGPEGQSGRRPPRHLHSILCRPSPQRPRPLRPQHHPGPAREPGCLGAGGHEPLRASPSRAVLTGKLRLRGGGTRLGGEQSLGCCPEGAGAHSRPRAGLSPDPCPRAPAPSPDPKPVSPASLREPGRALASPPGLPLGSPRAPAVPSSALPLDALAQSPRSSGVEGGALGHQAK